MGTRKRKNNDAIESDTDPIGKPKRKGKSKKNERPLSDLILEGRSATVHVDPPKKKRRWLRWGLIGFGVLWVMSLFAPPRDKATPPPQANQVAVIPTNTVQPTITPVNRATLTAQALVVLDVAKTQTAPTQTPIIEYVVITATPSETDIPTETGIPTDVPLPSATLVPSATPLPTNTAMPTQSGVRVITDTGVVTGQSVRVRSCASTECQELGRLFNGVTFPITGSVSDGQSVEGNRLWYQITYNGQVGYVSATLAGIASAQAVSPPVGQNVSPIQPTQPIVAPISLAPAGGWDCSYDKYNCGDFSNREQLMDYFNICLQQTGRDVSRLDQGGVAGVPCED